MMVLFSGTEIKQLIEEIKEAEANKLLGKTYIKNGREKFVKDGDSKNGDDKER